MNKNTQILDLLQKNRGKFFTVEFEKKNGEIRKLNARQGVVEGSTPLSGGQWSNSSKEKPPTLVLCTDLAKEKAKEHSRRSFYTDTVRTLKIAGKTYTF